MGGHLVKLMKKAVRVHVAEAGPDGIVDKEHIRELIPRSFIVLQFAALPHPIRSHFHQRAVQRTTPWTTVEPYHCTLPVCDVSVLEMPEKEVSVMLWRYLDVAGSQISFGLNEKNGEDTQHASLVTDRPVRQAENGHSSLLLSSLRDFPEATENRTVVLER